MVPRSGLLKFLLVVCALALVMALTAHVWLSALGYALVREDGPAKAELAVVLAGDGGGRRISKAGDLVRAGFVPEVLVDGPLGFYGAHECDLAIPFAVRAGYPAAAFTPFPFSAHSTEEEARLVVRELERRHIHSFVLVTSNYHTARSTRIFRAALKARADAATMRVVGSTDEAFSPDSWWRTREGRKQCFLEWSKTVSELFGM